MNEAYRVIPWTPMRKAIAARLSDTQRTVPQFSISIDVEVDPLLKLRDEMSTCVSRGKRISFTPFLVKASAAALMQVPSVNLQFVDNEIRQFVDADVAVVVSNNDTLSTPIIRRANGKSIVEISSDLENLSIKTAKKTLTSDEVYGGTFTISNLGMYGAERFNAIVNQPQCAILAVGGVRRTVKALETEGVETVQTMSLTLSVDHRVIDGVTAAKFLSALTRSLAQPAGLV